MLLEIKALTSSLPLDDGPSRARKNSGKPRFGRARFVQFLSKGRWSTVPQAIEKAGKQLIINDLYEWQAVAGQLLYLVRSFHRQTLV